MCTAPLSQTSQTITLDTDTFQWVIDKKGTTLSLCERATGDNRFNGDGRCNFVLLRGNRRITANSVELRDNRLLVNFTEPKVNVGISVVSRPSHLILKVETVQGADFDRLFFVDTPLCGQSSEAEDFCLAAVSLNLKTRVDEFPGPQECLEASCYPKFGVEGAAVAIVGSPFAKLRSVFKEVVSASPDLPHSPLGGPWALDHPQCHESYMFCNPTEENIEDWIRVAKDFGIGELHFSSGLFSLGDYAPNPTLFPDGLDAIRRMTDRIHRAGLHAGFHTLSNGISAASPYVTPVPDPRLGTEKILTLASPLGIDDREIRVNEATDDMPRKAGYFIRHSMTLMIEEELVTYSSVDGDTLSGCTRGVHNTSVSAHPAGTPAHLLMACWGLYSVEDNSLFTEVAANIARVINHCDFDMVYLDGLDGINLIDGEDGRWHYGGRFAFEIYERLNRPILMEMATFLHHLWFVRGRMGAWDHAGRSHRKFIDLHCRSNQNFRRIFLPAHLGWWSPKISTSPATEVSHVDDVAHLASKAFANDIGLALQQITPETVETIPHFARLGPIFKCYEDLRQRGTVPESWRRELAKEGAEFAFNGNLETPQFHPVARFEHKIQSPDGSDASWTVRGEHCSQSPTLRLELLRNTASYDVPEAVTLADFSAGEEFIDEGIVTCAQNSGKNYSYPAVPWGLTARIAAAAPILAPDRLPCGEFTATRQAESEPVPAAGPDDKFSILDHGERFFETKPASWVRLTKNYPQTLDLSGGAGIGFWLFGDNSGATLNVQLCDCSTHYTFEDKYVPLDFSGWRYIRLLEAEAERFEALGLPYGACVYDIYRFTLAVKQVCSLNLWYANIAPNSEIRCLFSPIRALPLVDTELAGGALEINGVKIPLPTNISSGQWLEADADGNWKLFTPNGTLLRNGKLEVPLPELHPGENRLELHSPDPDGTHRCRVSLTTNGQPLA